MKVLVPLDGSRESEEVFNALKQELAPDDTVLLLKVVPPGKTQTAGSIVIHASQLEESRRNEAMSYLGAVADRLEMGPDRCQREVAISDSVVQGILDIAEREKVGRIAMYTHDRKGLAKLIKGSVAKQVQRKATVDVSAFGPRELASAG